MPPDVVYPIRRRGDNEELRYSLRSLQNLPHGKVWFVGDRPTWARNVEFISRAQYASKYLNATTNLIFAAEAEGVSDPFILMNDDFFVMRKMRSLPVLHRGPLAFVLQEHVANYRVGPYIRGMAQTGQLLRNLGIKNPMSYELHLPMAFHKEPLLEAWDVGQHIPVLHIRTLYGNLAEVGGKETADCKVYHRDEVGWYDWPFISTNDSLQSVVGEHIRSTFPDLSPYEDAHAGTGTETKPPKAQQARPRRTASSRRDWLAARRAARTA